MFKITFFLLFLAVLAVKGNEVEVADDYDPTVPMTCFIITFLFLSLSFSFSFFFFLFPPFFLSPL